MIVGAAAVEPYGQAGLLRSVVVAESRRGTGLGRELVAAAEALAQEEGIRELYLLTETAADWFPRLGYEVVDREEARAAVGDVRRVHDGLCDDRRADAAAPGLTCWQGVRADLGPREDPCRVARGRAWVPAERLPSIAQVGDRRHSSPGRVAGDTPRVAGSCPAPPAPGDTRVTRAALRGSSEGVA